MAKAGDKHFEEYPIWIVLLSNLVTLLIYLLGICIMFQWGILWMILYIVYILILEVSLMKKSCVHCSYYGKSCAFGRGKLSSVFFKKGNSRKFSQKEMSCKDIIPDFLVSIVPIAVGIVLLIINFTWLLVLNIIIIALLSSLGNSLIRGSLACKFCKQRKAGCPAEKLFNKR
jgi:hypothetical protein